ncbi:unnamed protein product [marine sediment metagenome]|uniref:Uncharacterized protein n=1 Tax=marine sediment metagenome TaxID=412755 RepID=X1F5U0_9ZZZZ
MIGGYSLSSLSQLSITMEWEPSPLKGYERVQHLMYAALTSVTSQLEVIGISGKIYKDFSDAPAISYAGQGLAEFSG